MAKKIIKLDDELYYEHLINLLKTNDVVDVRSRNIKKLISDFNEYLRKSKIEYRVQAKETSKPLHFKLIKE